MIDYTVSKGLKVVVIDIILEKAVGRTHIAQVIDSPGYMKKVLITNKVTTHFFITPFKSIPSTLHALPTAFSRMIHQISAFIQYAG